MEVELVELAAIVRGVKVTKRRRPVVPRTHLLIRQALNLHPREALVRFLDGLRQPFEIESRRLRHIASIVLIADASRIGVLLKIKVPCRSLDVGQGCRIGRLKQLVPLPAHKHITHVADEFFIVLLADAIEVHQLAVEVVQYLDLGRLLLEEHLCAASKRFDVRRVIRKYLDDLLCNRALTADVGQWTSHNSVSGFSGVALWRLDSTFMRRSVAYSYAT